MANLFNIIAKNIEQANRAAELSQIKAIGEAARQREADGDRSMNEILVCTGCGVILTTANSGTIGADGEAVLGLQMCNPCLEDVPVCEVCDEAEPSAVDRSKDGMNVLACDSCWSNRPGHGEQAECIDCGAERGEGQILPRSIAALHDDDASLCDAHREHRAALASDEVGEKT